MKKILISISKDLHYAIKSAALKASMPMNKFIVETMENRVKESSGLAAYPEEEEIDEPNEELEKRNVVVFGAGAGSLPVRRPKSKKRWVSPKRPKSPKEELSEYMAVMQEAKRKMTEEERCSLVQFSDEELSYETMEPEEREKIAPMKAVIWYKKQSRRAYRDQENSYRTDWFKEHVALMERIVLRRNELINQIEAEEIESEMDTEEDAKEALMMAQAQEGYFDDLEDTILEQEGFVGD